MGFNIVSEIAKIFLMFVVIFDGSILCRATYQLSMEGYLAKPPVWIVLAILGTNLIAAMTAYFALYELERKLKEKT